jgi:hypothetical protein
MKKLFMPVLLICIVISACKKDTIEHNSGFVSVVESGLDYTTRNCFQLSDGSYIICGSNVIWPAGNSLFGNSYSMMAKFSTSGDLIWQRNLPITLCDLWKGISLPGGGFILAGLDNMPENTNITIAEYNNNGGLVKSNQLVNHTGTGSTSRNCIDFCNLSNGNIAMVLNGISLGVQGVSPRLLVFDSDLNIISDKFFPSMFSATKNYKSMKIVEGNNGKLFICGTTQEFNAWSWTFLMGIDGTTLNTDFFTEKIGGDTNSYPGPFIVSDAGHVLVPTAEQFRAGIFFNISDYFYYHLDEYFSVGKTVSALETDADGSFIARHKYSGFTGYASLTNITKAKDGGYLMIGTCDLRTDAVIYSPFQILLIKTNSRLEQEWMKQINTTYPAVAVDVKSTDDGGFVIGAYEKSFSNNYKMMLIKTDANGSMQ